MDFGSRPVGLIRTCVIRHFGAHNFYDAQYSTRRRAGDGRVDSVVADDASAYPPYVLADR